MRIFRFQIVLLLAIFQVGYSRFQFLNGYHLFNDLIDEESEESEFFADVRISSEWFDQRLNHFEPTNTQTWKQRYFVNFVHAENDTKNAPIFLMLAGEGESSGSGLGERSNMAANAKHYKAIAIELEHRYYGQSKPTQNMSVANLKYLTSEQALQDAASFISYFKNKHGLHQNKWIVFGGSYAGNLAAWFRLKYPHLVSGAIASSAPVQAVLNFTDYLKVVAHSLGTTCTANIRTAFSEITTLLKTSVGWKKIDHLFHLCEPLNGNNRKDVENLISDFVSDISGIVQYNNEVLGRLNVDKVCAVMANSSIGSLLERYATLTSQIRKSQKCHEHKYENVLKQMGSENWHNRTNQDSGRLWTYQTCTEFGYFQTSDDPSQPFGPYIPLDFYVQMCIDIFGPQFNQRFTGNSIDFSNNHYGGANFSGTFVVFPNGIVDPWHAISVLSPIGETITPLLTSGAAHCADMRITNDPAIKKTQEVIRKKIGEFLKH